MSKATKKSLGDMKRAFLLVHSTFSSRAFLVVLDTFGKSAEAREEASRNVSAYLRKHNVRVPRGVTAKLVHDNWCISLTVKIGRIKISIRYTPKAGLEFGSC
jgi:hypothetical protein